MIFHQLKSQRIEGEEVRTSWCLMMWKTVGFNNYFWK